MSFSYSDSAAEGILAGVGIVSYVITIIVCIILIIAQWKLFTKAGKPGWAALIPFYNMYVLFDIIYGAGWKFVLIFVPFLNIAVMIMQPIRMAQAYGKGVGFGVLNLFFPEIMQPILAFSKSTEYMGSINSFL